MAPLLHAAMMTCSTAGKNEIYHSGFVRIASIKDEDEERAWEVFLKYKDKDFSYTDCTSFSFMQRMQTETAFSFDAHFKAMRLRMVPE